MFAGQNTNLGEILHGINKFVLGVKMIPAREIVGDHLLFVKMKNILCTYEESYHLEENFVAKVILEFILTLNIISLGSNHILHPNI
jgi:hypothetical protein